MNKKDGEERMVSKKEFACLTTKEKERDGRIRGKERGVFQGNRGGRLGAQLVDKI